MAVVVVLVHPEEEVDLVDVAVAVAAAGVVEAVEDLELPPLSHIATREFSLLGAKRICLLPET